MLKPYPDKFTEDHLFTTPLHPSTWLLSPLTKNPLSAIVTTVGLLVIMLAVTIITSNFFALWATLMVLMFYFITMFTCFKSYKILRRDYNDHLFAIEETFNRMSYKDQRRYSSILKNAYEICENRDLDEYGKLDKIKELFSLTAPEANTGLSLLEKELKLKREINQINQAGEFELQQHLESKGL